MRVMDDKQKKLAKAKKVREKMLEEYKRLFEACNCEWPIRKLRNGSGHSDDCPAHLLHKQDREVWDED
jgi:hypothetical protein